MAERVTEIYSLLILFMRCAQLSCGIAEDGDPRSVAARGAPEENRNG
jgi:hypothetical protein